ncbi:uncharacterized protein [Spinacia oleracea]|uniref:Replication protein A 70 kDa DNA-binding subunit B/D first OB fold domain-containing protein n=1 Tax=Spinacia oleracea TaxID=3562 RepID=A0ABM3QXD4_SPIOL|nr:uncharacterized protein LOC130463020 [Spinacia oleracea]
MSQNFTPIHTINPSIENLTIQARVIRLWTVPAFNNPSERYTIEMVLLDAEEKKWSCTLWNQYVDQLTEYLSNHPNCQVVVAIQYAKIKTFHGVVGISSSLFVIRLHINTDIAEINDFKERFATV